MLKNKHFSLINKHVVIRNTTNFLLAIFPLFWHNKEKGADIMMNTTMFDPIALKAWY